jgi:FKBP-type peptidyl-prolyl cis-trans isomerase SlyD
MQATRGAVVSFNYKLTDDDGNTIDSSEGCAPLSYLHGYENIIPGLENALEGVDVGYSANVVVEPTEAYGEIDEEAIFEVDRDKFPPEMELAPGMQFAGETPSGDVPLTVMQVNDDSVIVNANHPLAGERLHFELEVVDIREATDEELQQGHPE